MTTIPLRTFCSYCYELLTPSLFDDFCTNGLQVEGRGEIAKILVAVTASLAAIDAAVAADADLLLVHHGLFWRRDSYDIIGPQRQKLKALLANDISLVAYHLPLDAHPLLGNNFGAAIELGWHELAPFPAGERNSVGVVASCEPQSAEALRTALTSYYGNTIDLVAAGPSTISRIALISGGAHKELAKAVGCADCFITGSRDEPTWHQAKELGLHFAAVGHYASETIGPRRLGDHLQRNLGVSVDYFWEPNPF